jgi:hypothetical protein
VGYIWRIEFGIEMGFHCHWVLIFNGNKSQQDIVLADAIGDYWRNSITQGYGTYWNCNKYGGKFKPLDQLGVGMIHNSDTHMRKNLLEHVISYLTKVDEFIRLQVPEDMPNFRTFGRGEILSYRKVKRAGRPRVKKQK